MEQNSEASLSDKNINDSLKDPESIKDHESHDDSELQETDSCEDDEIEPEK